MARVIFHIDLNAFFATAEVLRNPELANKPLYAQIQIYSSF